MSGLRYLLAIILGFLPIATLASSFQSGDDVIYRGNLCSVKSISGDSANVECLERQSLVGDIRCSLSAQQTLPVGDLTALVPINSLPNTSVGDFVFTDAGHSNQPQTIEAKAFAAAKTSRGWFVWIYADNSCKGMYSSFYPEVLRTEGIPVQGPAMGSKVIAIRDEKPAYDAEWSEKIVKFYTLRKQVPFFVSGDELPTNLPSVDSFPTINVIYFDQNLNSIGDIWQVFYHREPKGPPEYTLLPGERFMAEDSVYLALDALWNGCRPSTNDGAPFCENQGYTTHLDMHDLGESQVVLTADGRWFVNFGGLDPLN